VFAFIYVQQYKGEVREVENSPNRDKYFNMHIRYFAAGATY